MALHKAQAQFARARWRIKLLGPIWLAQLLLTMAMMGLFSYRFGHTMSKHSEKIEAGKTPAVEYAWEVTNIVMSLVASLCTFIDIGRYYTESLTPWTMLFTHAIKATCALAILALDVTVYILLAEEKYSLIGIGLDGLLIILTGAMVTYAILAYRRLSAYDDYAHPANVKGYGFNDYSTSGKTAYQSSYNRGSTNGGLSVGSMNEPLQMESLDVTTPYHHQRDTQFEEYMAKRNSFNAARDLESNGSGQRRHSSPPQAHSPPLIGSPKALSPHSLSPHSLSPDPIATGQVKALQRGPTIPRSTSWASDHVLVAVPEEEYEGDHHTPADEVSLLSPDSHEMPGFDGPRVVQETDIPEPKWK